MHEAPTLETGDALDLVRTADGGWRVPQKASRGSRPKTS